MSKELDEFYKKYSARIIAMDDTPLVKVMDGGKFKLLSIEEYDNLKQKLAESEKKILELQEDSIRDNQIYNEQLAEQSDLIYHLKKQLNCDYYKPCPKCNNPYGASQFPSKDENGKDIYVCSNCNLIETVYKPLLAEKERKFQESCVLLENLRKSEEEKKDIAMKRVSELKQQLAEKEKEYKESVEKILSSRDKLVLEYNQDKISFAVEKLENVKCYAQHIQGGLINYIDNQIKQLKGVK